MLHRSLLTPLAAAAWLATAPALAQVDPALQAAARQAIETQPEVSARLNALRAGDEAVEISRGALRPRVALEASAGRTQDRITTRNPEGQRLNQTGVAVTASQLLWDGLGAHRDGVRSERERLVRWHELADATENATLEAARAHFDVLRFRRLVELAEDSYVQHRYAWGQLRSRFEAGVGRGVDLEQAGARLALAESNLISETANLHDVSARYQRVVGTQPPKALAFASLEALGLPGSPLDAVTAALRDSAQVSAGIEALRAARANAQARESLHQPKVEARVRAGTGRNFDGVPDQKRDTSAEIVLQWQLYNGGADQARVRQATHQLNQAADLRDKACRDVRQTVLIAYSDVRKLAEQQLVLERNTLAIEKARDAYRQQFDIGQRSLLDLLNAENELYTARRALANAQFDHAIAQARTLAAMQRLTRSLGLEVPVAKPAAVDGLEPVAEDLPARCPAEVVQLQTTGRGDLDDRAARMIQAAPPVRR
jgi:outer membrane protein, adhesin transport system